jgi:antitoxin component YwqK of YwqJK toxin-antitoxin module
MKHLIPFLIVIVLFSCNETNNSEQKQEDAKSNIRVSHYDNGKIKAEVPLNEEKQKHGLAKNYYKSGKIHLAVNYKNGLKHGESIWYYENGKPYRRNFYIENYKDSIETFYYEDGQIQSQQSFKKGMYGNDLKEYTNSGKLRKKYPKLLLKQINDYHNGVILVQAKLSSNKSLLAWKYKKELGGFMNVEKSMIKHAPSEAAVPLKYSVGEIVFETVKINAAYKTKNGRVKVVTKSINIASN